MEQSTGLLQNLRADNMRIAIMFTNSDNGKAATVFRYFDGTLNASAITGIRNQALSALAALGEGTYEGLCYYRNSQGACYNNSPADFTASTGSQGDPFFHLTSAVVRVNPLSDTTTSNANAKWLVLVGSGPTGYDGSSTQTSKVFALEMPKPWTAGSSLVATTFPTTDLKAFMGDLVTLDDNLDYRGDVMYFGDVVTGSGTPAWTGKMYRLSTGGGIPTTAAWGLASGTDRVPTVVISSVSCSPSPFPGPTPVGPVLGAPTLTADDSARIWLFFGTGRYFSPGDKTNADTQHFFGVKDPVASGACMETTTTNCERNDLVDVSSTSVCIVCTGGTTQVSGVASVTNLHGTSTTTLQGLVQSKDGWVTTLPASRERIVVSPTVIGGIVFFPSFVPSNDLCTASGNSYLYASSI